MSIGLKQSNAGHSVTTTIGNKLPLSNPSFSQQILQSNLRCILELMFLSAGGTNSLQVRNSTLLSASRGPARGRDADRTKTRLPLINIHLTEPITTQNTPKYP